MRPNIVANMAGSSPLARASPVDTLTASATVRASIARDVRANASAAATASSCVNASPCPVSRKRRRISSSGAFTPWSLRLKSSSPISSASALRPAFMAIVVAPAIPPIANNGMTIPRSPGTLSPSVALPVEGSMLLVYGIGPPYHAALSAPVKRRPMPTPPAIRP